MDIRPIDLDSPLGRALLQKAVAELNARYEAHEHNPGVLDAEAFRPANGGPFLVAFVDDEPAGCGGLRRIDPNIAEVKRMYVEPAFRGRGIGRRVLEELELFAKRLGYRIVRLETATRQPEAIRLYASSGYRRIPGYGVYADSSLSVCFEKSLE
ncbi:MAG: GNAT family N-acetyltransferase [Gemmataceae bacterium]